MRPVMWVCLDGFDADEDGRGGCHSRSMGCVGNCRSSRRTQRKYSERRRHCVNTACSSVVVVIVVVVEEVVVVVVTAKLED